MKVQNPGRSRKGWLRTRYQHKLGKCPGSRLGNWKELCSFRKPRQPTEDYQGSQSRYCESLLAFCNPVGVLFPFTPVNLTTVFPLLPRVCPLKFISGDTAEPILTGSSTTQRMCFRTLKNTMAKALLTC